MSLIFAFLPFMPPGPCINSFEMAGRPGAIDSMVSEDFPIRVHWQEESQEAKAAAVLEYAELAWQVQVEELGFRAPQLPDSADGPELDIYVRDIGGWAAWATADGSVDAEEGDGYASVPAFIVVDSNIDDEWLGPYIVHEFNHVLQWSMDFNEPTWPIFEAVATAAQKWTLGDSGNWFTEVNTFQEIPWAPAILGDSYVIYKAERLGYYYEYGASLWVMHLDEVLGTGDGSAGALLWEATANEGILNEPDALDAFVEISGGDLGEALNRLARTRWLIGDEWDSRGLAEAKHWEPGWQVPFEELTPPIESAMVVDLSPAPQITGQSFYEVNTAAVSGRLEVSVQSVSGLQSGLMVLTWASDGSVGELSDAGDEPLLEIDLSELQKVVIAVSNLGPSNFDGDSNPYVDGDQRLHLRHDLDEGTDEEPQQTDSGSHLNSERKRCGCDVPGRFSWMNFATLGMVFCAVGVRRRLN